jgi:hypothetical protein
VKTRFCEATSKPAVVTLAGCSKTARYKAPKIPRREAYTRVRRNDEG